VSHLAIRRGRAGEGAVRSRSPATYQGRHHRRSSAPSSTSSRPPTDSTTSSGATWCASTSETTSVWAAGSTSGPSPRWDAQPPAGQRLLPAGRGGCGGTPNGLGNCPDRCTGTDSHAIASAKAPFSPREPWSSFLTETAPSPAGPDHERRTHDKSFRYRREQDRQGTGQQVRARTRSRS
jgi:hypothetical protein